MGQSREVAGKTLSQRRSIEVLMILAVFLVAGGSPPPEVNEPHYLCRLKHFWQPDWCRGDLFLESPDAHFTIVWGAGWATKWLSLPALAWAGRLLAWCLLAWAWRRLSWRVTPVPWCSILTACLWVVGMQWHLAGEWVIGGVESKCFAYALVLLALEQYLDGRWKRVWPLLGIACSLHALVGAWTIVVLFAMWTIHYRKECRFGSMTPSLALGALLALPGVLPPILMNWGIDARVVDEANQIYVFFRLPHHLALLSMQPDWLYNRAARNAMMLGVLALLTAVIAWRRRDEREPHETATDSLVRLARFAWGAATVMTTGLAIEFLLRDSPSAAAGLLKYYWHRLNDVAAPLAAALILGALLAAAFRGQRSWAPWLLTLLIGVSGWRLYERLDAGGLRSIPPADRAMADYDNWRAACQWANESTPSDALFLTPKYAQSFKWRAGRPEVATWKDVPQNAAGLVQWRRRIDDIYTQESPTGERYGIVSLSELGAGRLRVIGQKYGAQYILTDRYRPVSLPVAYQNDTYVVYDLSPASSDSRP